jgi:hypothetical protein
MVYDLDSSRTGYHLDKMPVPWIPWISAWLESARQLIYESTTTMGESELVTKHSPFHIISPDATTFRKLRAWNRSCLVSLTTWKYTEGGEAYTLNS